YSTQTQPPSIQTHLLGAWIICAVDSLTATRGSAARVHYPRGLRAGRRALARSGRAGSAVAPAGSRGACAAPSPTAAASPTVAAAPAPTAAARTPAAPPVTRSSLRPRRTSAPAARDACGATSVGTIAPSRTVNRTRAPRGGSRASRNLA